MIEIGAAFQSSADLVHGCVSFRRNRVGRRGTGTPARDDGHRLRAGQGRRGGPTWGADMGADTPIASASDPARSATGPKVRRSPWGRRRGPNFMLSETTLRSAIECERALISRLKDKISDEPLKLLLQSASSTLAFALMGFLDPKILERTRTPAELESWPRDTSNVRRRCAGRSRKSQSSVRTAADSGSTAGTARLIIVKAGPG
jgi:hypothetical protein